MKYSFTRYAFLIFSIFVLNPVSRCLPKYAIHAKHGIVTSPGLCVLHTTLSEKGSTLPWGQSVSDMHETNVYKTVLTSTFYRDPYFYILLQALLSKITFRESADKTLLTGG